MIYTVFPLVSNGNRYFAADELPQDFPTYAEALAYAEELTMDYIIESVNGECV